ncbi:MULTISPECIES: PD-(D/E)XK nuclease family protein [Aequorivita]|uniref:PD-(D/E)XK nuclease family protein n=1 Tax=Aequorivita iocasae TaxID=2803865 RepID=A0ABX7DU94_9FLAO|nr:MULTISPECIES: PD-(D/E)XK nuclease family protein [Aequorivita]QQX77715.1 PD-(D/E)XK nuclease family protein [Aequorivita iocasae]UCA57215.1 PD-(D/E)XK nuclease family protein [Aequorivita sp. F7]
MLTFLQEALADIKNSLSDISEITFILPSKRAGGFLLNELKKNSDTTLFAPKIWSIEEFIEELSGLKIIDNTELLFKSYEAYLSTDSIKEKEDFESYSTWAITLLNDFNEIDRYLVDHIQFFNYLASIKTLERWGVKEEKTELINNYLQFWESLPGFYENIQSLLLKEQIGYQGMVYREASANIEHYINNNKNKIHAFIGFNALNLAEQHIIQELLETENTMIYWDADRTFYEDLKHSASHFIRKYINEWKYFQQKTPKFIAQNYEKPKGFQFIEVQKNIGQAKHVGEMLSTRSEDEINKTAIVLGDENLLVPLLYSLPKNVKNINLTMGISLKNFPAVVFFEKLFAIHHRDTETLYYKDILSILNHPLGKDLLSNASDITQTLIRENNTHNTFADLIELSNNVETEMLELLFKSWKDSSTTAIKSSLKIIDKLQKKHTHGAIESMVLHQLKKIFSKIDALNQKYPHLKSVKSISILFSELIATTSLDFEGDAYSGLQVMGVLETRVLDFENVIITSVNEGIFPSGKSNASFITYDLKQQFGLPLYLEKDAIYTYHFYRLLHRATNITLLYNNHSEGINTGEKSRFIRQLEVEKQPAHTIEKCILSPKVKIKAQSLKQIQKTEAIMMRVREIAEKGFSPSSLTSYIRNPIEFYFQKILKLNEFEEVEETVAANTLGTIVHDTLEIFYKPLEGSFLSIEKLSEMKNKIHEQVTSEFKKTFKGGTFTKGKNLIIFEVAKRYISNFIDRELADIQAGNSIKIIKIESDLTLKIPIQELDFPVNIHGKVDRVDEYNGQLRIMDYKTGLVTQGDVEIIDWEKLNQDYKFSKAFQVLAYALMMNKKIPINNAEAGIISFKNLGSGFLKFGTKTSPYSKRNQQINSDVLETFTVELKKLILEICDPNIPFTEKEISK